MPQQQFRVFLSAVTSEFGKARDAIGADLRSRDTLVRVQSDFRQEWESDTTLKKLHDYIRDCSAVVCVIGKRVGAFPPPAAAAPFNHMLPRGIAAASYTQWEFFFARHFKRRLSIYIADDDHKPEREPDTEDDPKLQIAFIAHIVDQQGLDRSSFSNKDELRAVVLREDWPKKPERKPIVLPYLSLGSLFKGRETFLADLHSSLNRRAGRTAITGSVLYGLGGIGKTRAAVEYALAHQEDYSALLFVVAETPEALRRSLAALVGPEALNLPEQNATEEPVRLRAVLDWLGEHPGCLLIVDNVDTPEALAEAEHLLSTLGGGHAIITSRLANFGGHFDPLELDVLGLEAAAAFLMQRTDKQRPKMPDDAAAAQQLAVDLGQLALALEQAGAYVAKLGLTFARYRQLWQGNWARVAGWADPAITKYPRAVAVTWQTSVNQLSEPGRRLLERLAWLAPEPVPNFLVEVPIPDVVDENIEEALADLAAYSLVRRNPQRQEFSVHRLVQDVTRRSLIDQESPPSLIGALGWINSSFPFEADDVRYWPRAEPLAPHARAITEHADAAGISEPTARLMSQLGLLLGAKALFAEAEPLYRRALAIAERSYGADHPNVATCLNNLAGLLRGTNRPSEAEPLYRRALAIDEKSYGPDHPEVATDLNNLAELLRTTDRLSEAEPLYRRALAIDEKRYGPDYPEVATDLNNLAVLLEATNRRSEAEPLYRRALAIDEKSYGSDHPKVAIRLNNLALLLRDTNRLSEAEPMLRRALVVFEHRLGSQHPSTLTVRHNLATLRPSQ
jgi:tetratricopeptide (TPR) repeat protein